MKKILVIYTGGTIGMRPSEQGYVPVEGFDDLFREKVGHAQQTLLPDYDLIEFSPLIDSANLNLSHWHNITSTIIQHYDQYSGFIVLHGTDTMAYTASALSFALQGLDKPVVLTGSQIPLAELRNDALDNLLTALLFVNEYPVNEVCICFNGRLLRGNRSRKVKATELDAFDSPNFPWLGQAGLHIKLRTDLQLPPQEKRLITPDYQPDAVCVMPVFPGMSAAISDHLCNNEQIKGLILQSYGVGNLPDQNQTLIDNLAKAANRGCAILNISQCVQADVQQGQYACSSILNDIGVISGADMTLEASFAKMHHLIATEQASSNIKAKLALNLAGEMRE